MPSLEQWSTTVPPTSYTTLTTSCLWGHQQTTPHTCPFNSPWIHVLKSPSPSHTTKHKAVTHTHRLTFLGIEIYTSTGTLSLPHEKLERLQSLLIDWRDRKAVPKRDLLSLLGHLSHASTVIRPGRIFVRHLIDASTHVFAPHHFVRLTCQCHADLMWWLEFGLSWSGSSLWHSDLSSLSCYSDASGN